MHTSSRADVLAMNAMVAKFGQQNIPHHNRLFARGRPSGQTEQRAPVTFVHDAVTDQIVILTMIKHWQSNHTRVLERATHPFMLLHTSTNVSDPDHAGLA